MLNKAIARQLQVAREAKAEALKPVFLAIAAAQESAAQPILSLVQDVKKATTKSESVWPQYAKAIDAIAIGCKDMADADKQSYIDTALSMFSQIVPELPKGKENTAYSTLRSYRSRFNKLVGVYPYQAQYKAILQQSDEEAIAKLADLPITEVSYNSTTAIVSAIREAGDETSEDVILLRKERDQLKDVLTLCIEGQREVKATEKRDARKFVAAVDPATLLEAVRAFKDACTAMSKKATDEALAKQEASDESVHAKEDGTDVVAETAPATMPAGDRHAA